MILFIDDESRRLAAYIEELSARLPTKVLQSVSDVETFLSERIKDPTCIVLDIMLPGDASLPAELTSHGLTAGMPLFAILRSYFPIVPIVIFTNSPSIEVKRFFENQKSCFFRYKTDLLPRDLAALVVGIVENRGRSLLALLEQCATGGRHARQYESLCVQILQYLFVPPLKDVIPQSRRADGHDIRDAILPNAAANYFWASLRNEFSARHIVVEFKNYTKPIRKTEVIQLRSYLKRKSIGRFGLILSRLPPSDSALQARGIAYAEDDCLILFLDDRNLGKMIELREEGKDPALVLEAMKQEFELQY